MNVFEAIGHGVIQRLSYAGVGCLIPAYWCWYGENAPRTAQTEGLITSRVLPKIGTSGAGGIRVTRRVPTLWHMIMTGHN